MTIEEQRVIIDKTVAQYTEATMRLAALHVEATRIGHPIAPMGTQTQTLKFLTQDMRDTISVIERLKSKLQQIGFAEPHSPATDRAQHTEEIQHSVSTESF
jgi:hypothetical protein